MFALIPSIKAGKAWRMECEEDGHIVSADREQRVLSLPSLFSLKNSVVFALLVCMCTMCIQYPQKPEGAMEESGSHCQQCMGDCTTQASLPCDYYVCKHQGERMEKSPK